MKLLKFLNFFIPLLLLANFSFSQLAVWNPSGLSAYGPSPWSPTTLNSNLTAGGLTRGTGVGTSGTSAANAWGGTMNNASQTTSSAAISVNQFITFSLKPNTGYFLSLSTFDLNYRRSATGPSAGLLQYSINGGSYTDISTLAFTSTSSSGSSIGQVSLSGISALQNVTSASTITFRIVLYSNTTVNGTFYVYNTGMSINGTVISSSPTIITTGTPSSLSTVSGLVSPIYTSFIVSGTNLTSDIIISAPSGSLISTNPNSGYTSSLTLTQTSGVVNNTTIYIILDGTSPSGSYSGNITLSSTGATNVIVIITGNVSLIKWAQTITFFPISNKSNTDTIKLYSKSSAGLPITYTSSNTNIANIVSDTIVAFTGVGSVTITASQIGNSYYSAATDISRTLNVYNTLSKWHFESILTSNIGSSMVLSAGTNVADLGCQTASTSVSGLHSSLATTWSTPAGNGSAKSISSNTWSVGDYFEFKVSSTDYHNVGVLFDHSSSATGPKDFKLQYSINSGSTWIDYVSYTVQNFSWSNTYNKDSSQQFFDLSSILVLNNISDLRFRLTNSTTTAVNGGLVGTGGTSRIDNFRVVAIPNTFQSKQDGQWSSYNTWNIKSNGSWSPSIGPYPTDSQSNVVIQSPHNIIIGSISTCGDLLLNGSISMNSDLSVYGSITSNGTITCNNNKVYFTGTTNASIINDLRLDKMYLTKSSSTLTLNGNVKINTELSVVSGSLDLSNKDITLSSNSTSTASLSPVSGTILYNGTGRFVVERYIPIDLSPSSRRWRLLTSPLSSTGAPSINSSWQEGVNNNDRLIPQNPNPGYGTTITSTTTAVNGFDQGSTNNPSIYNWNGSGWVVPSSTYNTITNENGYMLFIRGDRSIVVGGTNVIPTPTTLRCRGKVNVGNVTITQSNGLMVVGNPYPSRISLNNISFNDTLGSSKKTFYLWDPKTSGNYSVGKFITCSGNGDGTYTLTSNSSNLPTDGTIESGQAFMIMGNGGNITFHESDKTSGSSTIGIASRPLSPTYKYVTSLYKNNNGNLSLADGIVTIFGDSFSDTIDDWDSRKLSSFNTKESLSSIRNNDLIAIERRSTIDTIFLNLSKLDVSKYTLKTDATIPSYLVDKFLQKKISISDSSYDFDVTSDTNSYSNRFMIVFNQTVLPIKFISVNATKNNKFVTVRWDIDNTSSIRYFNIEKSIDGINFNKVSTTNLNSWVDSNISKANFYRVVAFDITGEKTFSKIVNVNFNSHSKNIITYNGNVFVSGEFKVINPVGQTIQIGRSNIRLSSKGLYTVKLKDDIIKIIYL